MTQRRAATEESNFESAIAYDTSKVDRTFAICRLVLHDNVVFKLGADSIKL